MNKRLVTVIVIAVTTLIAVGLGVWFALGAGGAPETPPTVQPTVNPGQPITPGGPDAPGDPNDCIVVEHGEHDDCLVENPDTFDITDDHWDAARVATEFVKEFITVDDGEPEGERVARLAPYVAEGVELPPTQVDGHTSGQAFQHAVSRVTGSPFGVPVRVDDDLYVVSVAASFQAHYSYPAHPTEEYNAKGTWLVWLDKQHKVVDVREEIPAFTWR